MDHVDRLVNRARARWRRIEARLPPPTRTAIALGREAATAFARANPPALASQVAYGLLFTMPSIVLVVVAGTILAGRVTGFDVAAEIREAIVLRAPPEVREVLLSLFDVAAAQFGVGPSVGTLTAAGIALWWAAGGFGALAGACTLAYGGVDPRPFWRKQLVYVAASLLLTALLVGAFTLFVFGETIRAALAEDSWLGFEFELPPALLRWPVAIALVFGALLFLYTVGAGVAQSPRWVVPGAALATLAWAVVVKGFEIYLRFVDLGVGYGALGGVLVFLFFLYVSSLVFIGGAMVTAVLGRHFDAKAIADVAARAAADGICPPPVVAGEWARTNASAPTDDRRERGR